MPRPRAGAAAPAPARLRVERQDGRDATTRKTKSDAKRRAEMLMVSPAMSVCRPIGLLALVRGVVG